MDNSSQRADNSDMEATAQISNIKVKLEDFYGPIDLMLELAKERELDIADLTVSAAIEQYIAVIKGLKAMNVDIAADFIYFASQLLLFKARSIIPYVMRDDEEEEEDPSADLIKKLIEYKKVRAGMEWIEERYAETSRSHTGPKFVRIHFDKQEEVDLQAVTMYSIVSTYARVKYSTEFYSTMEIVFTDIPIESYIKVIVSRLRATDKVSISEMFEGMTTSQTIGNVLAILELIKQEEVELNTIDDPYLRLRGVSQNN